MRYVECRMTRRLCASVALLFACSLACAAGRPSPPTQPKTGPGGAEYAHADVAMTIIGDGGDKVWIFEPAKPSPAKAPVVVFLHGWGAVGPAYYIEWIRHIARRGSIVIYPRYQASLLTPAPRMPPAAKAAIRAALAELGKGGHIRPDETKLAVVGHSLGGIMAMNLAAEAGRDGLPQPAAVMCVEPGEPKHAPRSFGRVVPIPSIMGDHSAVPKGTLVLLVVGGDDTMTGDVAARVIWKNIQHLPAADRDFVVVVSDGYGSPTLDATHLFPLAPARNSLVGWTAGGVDALDWFGTWKLFDGLTDAAFHGKNREYALGNTPEQRHMGKWSDGTPVKELQVADK